MRERSGNQCRRYDLPDGVQLLSRSSDDRKDKKTSDDDGRDDESLGRFSETIVTKRQPRKQQMQFIESGAMKGSSDIGNMSVPTFSNQREPDEQKKT